MNIAEYLQDRQYGLAHHKSRKFKYKEMDQLLDEKMTESFVNKPCSVSGTCRSTFIMEFSPDGTKVASTHGDHTVRVTEIATGQCVRTLHGHPRTPWCLAYHPSSSHILASGCLGGQVRIWDLYGYGCEVWQTENSTVIASLTFHPTDHVLVIAAGNSIYFWDWSQPEPFTKCSSVHKYERIRWLKFDRFGQYLYTGISNNTSIHRDEVSSVSLTSQGPSTSARQPSRLSSVYSRIINCYQEYRRGRLSRETSVRSTESATTGPSATTEIEEDSYPGVRDIDLVEPSSPPNVAQEGGISSNSVEATDTVDTSNSISDQIIHLSNRRIQNSERRAVRNVSDCLINPRNDPLFSQPSSQVSFENSRDSNLAQPGSESVNVLQEIVSQNRMRRDRIPAPSRNVLPLNYGNTVDLNVSCTTSVIDNSATAGAIYQSASTPSVVNTMNLPSEHSALDTSCSATSQVTLNSSLPHSLQTQAESLRSSLTSCSDVNPYLARYLKGQASNKSSKPTSMSQPTKQFPSIRDRLQTSIPLASQTSSSAANKALSVTGIPPVTVLSLSDICRPVTVQSNTDSSLNRASVGKPVSVGHTCTYNTTVVEPSSSSTVLTSAAPSNKSSVIDTFGASGAGNKDLTHSGKTSVQDFKGLKSMNTVPAISAISITDTFTVNNTTPSSSAHLAESLADNKSCPVTKVSISATRNVPNSSSIDTSFHNVQTARAKRERRHYRNRVEPYSLPRQSRYSSLMGPYLESRGIRTPGHPQTISIPRTSDSLTEGIIPVNHQIHSSGCEHTRSQQTQRDNDRQDRVSSASTLNSSRNLSGYYFLPISENSRSNLESATIQNSVNQVSTFTQPECSIPNQSSSQTSGNNSSDQSIELFVDQNENYTAIRNANNSQVSHPVNEVQVSTNDSNNNSLHIIQQNPGVSSTASIPHSEINQDYIALRNTFVSMTDQIEREMSDLNRRINALRDSFNQSLFSIRQDRQRYENVGDTSETATASSSFSVVGSSSATSTESRNIPVIITSTTEPESAENEEPVGMPDTQGFMIQPPSLLETSLRSHRRGRQSQYLQRPYLESAAEPQDWRQLQRHYLHPHYSSSIFDETINRPSNAIQSAINRAIAGAFMGTGEWAVANNIINQTYRIQFWDFTKCVIPDIANSNTNIVVPHCRLHSSASCDISENGSLLATFVPSHHGFPDDNILAVYSLQPENRGQCLFTKSFGPNAISISISPSNSYVLVGLAAKKLSWVFTARQIVAQIYKLEQKEAGEKSTKLIKDIFHTCSSDIRTHVSGNSARWLPLVGQGLVYGTNRGHLHLCKPGVKTPVRKIAPTDSQGYDLTEEDDQSENVRRFILRRVPWLTHTDPHRVSASTQTQGNRHTAATQTEAEERDSQ